MKSKYVFIVGLPRTGTKLMMNILDKSQGMHCHITSENFFLGRVLRPGVRQKMRKIGPMSVDSNVHQLIGDMYSGKFYGAFWDSLVDGSLGVDRDSMLQRILNSDRSDKAIYTILLQIHAESTNNTILGDKSGPHLYRVPTLLEWFPDAKVIHTFRDPRAILASEHKKLFRKLDRRIGEAQAAGNSLRAILLTLTRPLLSLMIVLYITIAWLYAVRLHYKYKRLYPSSYYLSKFEDVVNEPEKSVRELCKFLSIEFHSAMLTPPKIDSSYLPERGLGFDKQTLTRWQHYLKPWMNAWLLLWGKKHLREFNYIP